MDNMDNFPVSLGEVVVCRTLAYYYLGCVTHITRAGDLYFLHLSDAFVISDVGDWEKTLQSGKFPDAKPLRQETRIGLHACVEIAPWYHKLPA